LVAVLRSSLECVFAIELVQQAERVILGTDAVWREGERGRKRSSFDFSLQIDFREARALYICHRTRAVQQAERSYSGTDACEGERGRKRFEHERELWF
jgi:hypothetical protein